MKYTLKRALHSEKIPVFTSKVKTDVDLDLNVKKTLSKEPWRYKREDKKRLTFQEEACILKRTLFSHLYVQRDIDVGLNMEKNSRKEHCTFEIKNEMSHFFPPADKNK